MNSKTAVATLFCLLTIGNAVNAYSVVSINDKAEQEKDLGETVGLEDVQEEGRGFLDGQKTDVLATETDKLAFRHMFNTLLWDADEYETVEETGRSMLRQFRRRGLLARPMPDMFRDQETFTGRLYTSFVDQCYGLMCRLGLGGLASALDGLMG